MNEKQKESVNITTLKAGDSVLIDTCSLIESAQRCSFLLSEIKCFVVQQAIRELTRLGKKDPNIKELTCKVPASILDETNEMRVEAIKFYRQYGLLWGLSYVDCLYIAAAKLNNIPLMSSDQAVIKVARKVGVNIIPMYINQKKGKKTVSVIISETVCNNVSFKDSVKMVAEEGFSDNIEVIAE